MRLIPCLMCGGQGWWVSATGALLSIRVRSSKNHMQRCFWCQGIGWKEVEDQAPDPDKCERCGDVERPCVCGRCR